MFKTVALDALQSTHSPEDPVLYQLWYRQDNWNLCVCLIGEVCSFARFQLAMQSCNFKSSHKVFKSAKCFHKENHDQLCFQAVEEQLPKTVHCHLEPASGIWCEQRAHLIQIVLER